MATVASAKSNIMKSVIPAVKKCLLPVVRPRDSAASTMYRSLSTATAKYRHEEDSSIQDDKQSRQASEIRRRGLHIAIDDSFIPLRSLGFGIDQPFNNPFVAASRGTGDVLRAGSRKPCDAIEDKDALHMRFDMPGLGKEDVKVYAEENALVIKFSDAELDGSARNYNIRIELAAKVFKLDQIKAQMKNGILKVTVPKFAEEENKNAINVQVEEGSSELFNFVFLETAMIRLWKH